MIALLLNSGRGTRMGEETREHPKCMCRLAGGETIISWQVKQLVRCGVLSGAGRPRSHQVSLSAGSGHPINCCDSSSMELACSVCSPCSKRTSLGVPCMRVAFKPAGPDK